MNESQRRQVRSVALLEKEMIAVRTNDDLNMLVAFGNLDRFLLGQYFIYEVLDVRKFLHDFGLDSFLHRGLQLR